MTTCQVATTISVNCLTAEDGERLYTTIAAALRQGTPITIDFTGVAVFASPFFNKAIGELYRDFDSEQLNTLLHLEHLSPDGLTLVLRVIENSKAFYKQPGSIPTYIDLLDDPHERPS